MALLLKYPTPEKLKNVSLQSLAKLLSKASNGYFGLGKAKEVKETAKSTFGVIDNCGIYASLISTYIKQILFIQDQVKEIDSQIAAIMSELDSKITTINGIGQALGAVLNNPVITVLSETICPNVAHLISDERSGRQVLSLLAATRCLKPTMTRKLLKASDI